MYFCNHQSANIGPRTNPGSNKKAAYGSGKETLRLRANGPARVEEAVEFPFFFFSFLLFFFLTFQKVKNKEKKRTSCRRHASILFSFFFYSSSSSSFAVSFFLFLNEDGEDEDDVDERQEEGNKNHWSVNKIVPFRWGNGMFSSNKRQGIRVKRTQREGSRKQNVTFIA